MIFRNLFLSNASGGFEKQLGKVIEKKKKTDIGIFLSHGLSRN
jgi:hypothetical protein